MCGHSRNQTRGHIHTHTRTHTEITTNISVRGETHMLGRIARSIKWLVVNSFRYIRVHAGAVAARSKT
jgi:hypothetical protein